MFSTYKATAKHKGFEFRLSKEEFKELVISPCFYCGIRPYRTWRHTHVLKNGTADVLMANGIDRVDNSKGYIQGNVVSACPKCNYAKRDMSLIEFKEWVFILSRNLNCKFGKGG
jgi:hypothetical protein